MCPCFYDLADGSNTLKLLNQTAMYIDMCNRVTHVYDASGNAVGMRPKVLKRA